MRIELSVEHDEAETGRRSVYSCAIELPDRMTAEAVEAHVNSILKLLDRHSRENDDDDTDGDAWKKPPTAPA